MPTSLLRRLLPLLLILPVVLPCWALPAFAAAGLYAGQVPVNSQSDEDRAGALRAALAQVVVKVSGDNAIVSKPDVAKAIANADKYVQQYQYAQDVANENGQPQVRLSLIAQFDRDAVDRLLADVNGAGRTAAADAGQPPPEQQSGTYHVWVSGITSAEDYARLIGSLTRNELIRSVQTELARGDGVQLRVDAASSLPRLLTSLAGSPVHVLNAKPPVEGIDALLGMQPPN